MKIVIKMLVVIMSLLLLVACDSGNNEGPEKVIEPIETKMELHNGMGYYAEDGKLHFAIAAEVQDKFICNSPYSPDNQAEYCWQIFFTDETNVYSIGTTWFKYISDQYPENVELTIGEMQTSLMKRKNNEPTKMGSYSRVCGANVKAENGLVIWEIEIPEDLEIQTDKIRIFDYEVVGSSSVVRILEEANRYIESGDLYLAYEHLCGYCNERNYSVIIDKENEILPKLFGKNISVKILDNNKMSFTYEVGTNLNDLLLNDTSWRWNEGDVDCQVGIVFNSFNDPTKPITYFIASYHEVNMGEGGNIKTDIKGVRHSLLKSDVLNAMEIENINDWKEIAKADIQVNGQKVTWTFDVPDGFNPYNVCIANLVEQNDLYFWD